MAGKQRQQRLLSTARSQVRPAEAGRPAGRRWVGFGFWGAGQGGGWRRGGWTKAAGFAHLPNGVANGVDAGGPLRIAPQLWRVHSKVRREDGARRRWGVSPKAVSFPVGLSRGKGGAGGDVLSRRRWVGRGRWPASAWDVRTAVTEVQDARARHLIRHQ